tara:strand:+ start:943 stop:1155 length:213 start_codon:yes stop_codon:yes gene_type:complete
MNKEIRDRFKLMLEIMSELNEDTKRNYDKEFTKAIEQMELIESDFTYEIDEDTEKEMHDDMNFERIHYNQ